jgi:phosphatidylglycerophosphate synthase
LERKHVDSIRLKGRDAFWTVAVIDPIVVPLVRRLVPHASVTPNRLTLASFLLATASAVAFAFDQLVAGAIVVQLAFWVDCMDGKLASARGESNPLGGLFDGIADDLRIVMNGVGLVIATAAGSQLAPVALTAFVGMRFALPNLAEARPNQRDVTFATVPMRSGAVLRAARRRAAPPATTVEMELLVYTVAPLAGHGAIAVGALLAASVESAHFARYVLHTVREARRRRT